MDHLSGVTTKKPLIITGAHIIISFLNMEGVNNKLLTTVRHICRDKTTNNKLSHCAQLIHNVPQLPSSQNWLRRTLLLFITFTSIGRPISAKPLFHANGAGAIVVIT